MSAGFTNRLSTTVLELAFRKMIRLAKVVPRLTVLFRILRIVCIPHDTALPRPQISDGVALADQSPVVVFRIRILS